MSRFRNRGCAGGDRDGIVPDYQRQAGARGRFSEGDCGCTTRRQEARDSGVVRRNAGGRDWAGAQYALSTLENFTLPGDVSASRGYWKETLLSRKITVPRPGARDYDSGYAGARVMKSLARDLVERLTVRKETIRALELVG